MKKMLLMALLFVSAYGAIAQTNAIIANDFSTGGPTFYYKFYAYDASCNLIDSTLPYSIGTTSRMNFSLDGSVTTITPVTWSAGASHPAAATVYYGTEVVPMGSCIPRIVYDACTCPYCSGSTPFSCLIGYPHPGADWVIAVSPGDMEVHFHP